VEQPALAGARRTDHDSLGGLAVAIRDFKGGVVMISHNDEFVGALASEQWHVVDGRVTHRGQNVIALDRFEDSTPSTPNGAGTLSPRLNGGTGSALPSGLTTPALSSSAVSSAVNSESEGGPGVTGESMAFRAKKKKKMTKKERKEREARRRLRHIEWLNSPKGTPHPPDTDDEA
jgi:elongation factor 3